MHGRGWLEKMDDRRMSLQGSGELLPFPVDDPAPLTVLHNKPSYLQSRSLGRTLLGTSHWSSSVSLRTDVGWA